MCNYLLFIFDTALEESPSEEYLELELELELNSINTHTSPGIPLSWNPLLFAASLMLFDNMLGRADS